MQKKKRSKIRIILVILAIVIVGGIAYTVFSPKDNAIQVTIEKVARRTITQTVSAVGKLQPEVEVKISPEVPGEIIFLGVTDGQSVKKGELLVRIQPDLVEAQLEQSQSLTQVAKLQIDGLKAEVERTQNDLKRITELFKKEFASKEELDRAKAAYESAEARLRAQGADYDRTMSVLKQSRAQALRTTIYAPITGTVTNLSVKQGEKVVGTQQMQGTEMMRVSDLSVMNAWVDVDENDIVNVKIGDTAKVSVDAIPDEEFIGVVFEIAHAARLSNTNSQDQVTNFQVKIRLLAADKRFRPGMSVNADIATETRSNVLAVPLQAVTVRSSILDANPDVTGSGLREEENETKKKAKAKKKPKSIVFVKKASQVFSREVETGLSDNGFIEVSKGLAEGEEIVGGPFQAVNKLLSDSAKIKVDTAGQKFRTKLR